MDISEDAKAKKMSEDAKWIAVKKALDLTEDLGKFLSKIVGPGASALGGLIGDQMKSWRAANLTRIASKWQKICEIKNIPDEALRELPFKSALLVVAAASMEDDDNVQELWAKLIFQATKSNAGTGISKMHVDLLKSINGLEALVLEIIFDRYGEKSKRGKNIEKLLNMNDIEDEKLRIALLNLQRLGVIFPHINEIELLHHRTIEQWEKTIDNDSIVEEFKKVVTNIVISIAAINGDPINDASVSRESYEDLLSQYGLSHIGLDLREAITGEEIVPQNLL